MAKHTTQLLGALRAAKRAGPTQGGFAVMFATLDDVSSYRETVLEFAKLTASQVQKPAWVLDLDFRRNAVFDDVVAQQPDLQKTARAFSGALDSQPLYKPLGRRLIATADGANPTKLLSLHEVVGHNLLVSRFQNESVAPGQKITLARSKAWWLAARQRAGAIIVHAPPLSQSAMALAFGPDVDGVVMVIDADKTPVEDVALLRDEIESEGGRLIGAVMTGVRADARFASRLAA